jgi:hypothetical protein
MSKTIPLRKEEPQTQRMGFSAEELIYQTQKILEVKEKAMIEDVHYGTIPSCSKPSLWKAGAEKLCNAFRLQPEFETTSRDDPNRNIKWEKYNNKNKKIEGMTQGYMEYDSRCTLTHIPTGDVWAKNVSGSCNNFEARYRSLSPYDVKNTLEKMAEKRALVAAVLIGTAASDIFTQDIEDMPQLINGYDNGVNEKPNGSADKKMENNSKKEGSNNNNERMASDKQVAYIKKLLKKKEITHKAFFEEWEEDFDSFDDIPFSEVNDVLAWIQEQ